MDAAQTLMDARQRPSAKPLLNTLSELTTAISILALDDKRKAETLKKMLLNEISIAGTAYEGFLSDQKPKDDLIQRFVKLYQHVPSDEMEALFDKLQQRIKPAIEHAALLEKRNEQEAKTDEAFNKAEKAADDLMNHLDGMTDEEKTALDNEIDISDALTSLNEILNPTPTVDPASLELSGATSEQVAENSK